ncbi:MAG: hypothetical protein QOK48_2380 [Blastocatellia bacterium]|nr:hypothetical protein [Blastocatellia bacterium]
MVKFLFEWLADPGCSPQIRESNADLETHGLLIGHSRNEINGLLLATSSDIPLLWLNRIFIRPQTVTSTHLAPSFVKPGRANHSLLQRSFKSAAQFQPAARNS